MIANLKAHDTHKYLSDAVDQARKIARVVGEWACVQKHDDHGHVSYSVWSCPYADRPAASTFIPRNIVAWEVPGRVEAS